MGRIIKNQTKLAIKEETTEAVYIAPVAGGEFIAVSGDAVEISESQEVVTRNLLGSSIGEATPRLTTKSVASSFSVEAKANGTEGTAPEYGLLLESGLGAVRSQATAVTGKITAVKASLLSQGITFTAKSYGVAGNSITIQVIDSSAGGLAYTEVSGAIIIDLGGATPTTAQVVTLLSASAYVTAVETTPGSVIVAAEDALENGADTSNTTTKIYLVNGDASKYNIGDMVVVKVAGGYHTSPIVAVDNTSNSVSITLLVADSAVFADALVISKVTTYYPAESGHPSISLSRWQGDEILDKAIGCKTTAIALSNVTVGALPTFDFSLEGLTYDRVLETIALTPSFDAALPPIALNACAYVDGVAIEINEFSMSIANTLGFVTSLCSANGKVASRITERKITGSINPYKDSTSIANFTKFKNGTEFSLFISLHVPTSVSGEYEDVVGIYLPKCFITSVADSDTDGNMQDTLSFSATRGTVESTDEIFISFI